MRQKKRPVGSLKKLKAKRRQHSIERKDAEDDREFDMVQTTRRFDPIKWEDVISL